MPCVFQLRVILNVKSHAQSRPLGFVRFWPEPRAFHQGSNSIQDGSKIKEIGILLERIRSVLASLEDEAGFVENNLGTSSDRNVPSAQRQMEWLCLCALGMWLPVRRKCHGVAQTDA
jgi:hypothetical protein